MLVFLGRHSGLDSFEEFTLAPTLVRSMVRSKPVMGVVEYFTDPLKGGGGVKIFNILTLSPVDILLRFNVPKNQILLHFGVPDNC